MSRCGRSHWGNTGAYRLIGSLNAGACGLACCQNCGLTRRAHGQGAYLGCGLYALGRSLLLHACALRLLGMVGGNTGTCVAVGACAVNIERTDQSLLAASP